MLNITKLMTSCLTYLLLVGAAPAFSNPSPAVEMSGNTKGTVVETMNAAGYTYLCLEQNGQKTWAAIRETSVNVGDEVEIASGAIMHNFTSQTLGRTFESIIFSRGIIKP
ncbi:MAG: hypothetical protein P8X63_15080 [Desulfuromonadaceae bacterium]